jgi:pyruvate formate lyase activating enzyme
LSSRDATSEIKIDRERCNNCGKCIDVCTTGALKFYGQTISIDEAFDELRRDMHFYSNSGGGITAGGGEPLNQVDFVTELFHRCREIGIHTTIDTCGYGTVSDLKKVLSETDLVLFDLKLMNSRYHKRFTGKNNGVILRNTKLIVASGVPMIIRIPLIPGINDSEENMVETSRFVSGLNDNLHVDLLPYHRFGEGKYKMLDREYQLNGVKLQNEESLKRFVEMFKQDGLDCAIQE